MKNGKLSASTMILMIFALGLPACLAVSEDLDLQHQASRDNSAVDRRIYAGLEVASNNDSRLSVRLVIQNDLESAVCIPTYLLPSDGGSTNDVFQVNTVNGDEVDQLMVYPFHEPLLVKAYEILPPGARLDYFGILTQRYQMLSGEAYYIKYSVEAFDCSAFRLGYPYSRTSQVRRRQDSSSDYDFFERTRDTVVRIDAEMSLVKH